ncbi:hypothetical protein AV530_003311 [Patagioenas fasciata monilis]|uniref:Uncharacterized protein n=1 Tax=Patagioenas fasciata monilis TaxID=372326 RepID=A0A1V4K1Z2_PATFA|nr:hypothetical protein AV530_003311 [Patagioenas fasciata monilis]
MCPRSGVGSGCFHRLFITAYCYTTLENGKWAIYLKRVLLIHAMRSSGLIRYIRKGLYYLMPTLMKLFFSASGCM